MRSIGLIALFVLIGTTVAGADMHSCMHDAETAYQSCLRWVAENRKPDSDCAVVREGRVAECKQLWENWGKR
jgi:hypothetical protein